MCRSYFHLPWAQWVSLAELNGRMKMTATTIKCVAA